MELGIQRNRLYKWKKELGAKGDAAFHGSGRKPASQQSEVERLKAAAYFAKELG